MDYPLVEITIVGKPGALKTTIAKVVKDYLATQGLSCEVGEFGNLMATKEFLQHNKVYCTIECKQI